MRVIFIVLLLISTSALAFKNETKLSNPEQEIRAEKLFKQIKCLVCQGESLAESNADMASDMRQLIRNKIEKGQNEEEILNYLSSRYGEVILQNPPFEGKTYALWLMPLVILVIGAIIILQKVKVKKYFKRNARRNRTNKKAN